MTDKQMLRVNGQWVDLAKVIYSRSKKHEKTPYSSKPYYEFYFTLKGGTTASIRVEIEEKEQFEKFLRKAIADFCNVFPFEYEPPPAPKAKSATSLSKTEPKKPKGYLEDVPL